MSGKSKIVYLLFIAILGVLIWQGYPIIKNRYFTDDSKKESSSPSVPKNETEEEPEDLEEDAVPKEEDKTNLEENQDNLKQEGKIFKKITRENCDNECAGFSDLELEYCQETCGLKIVEEGANDCDKLNGLQKDYCLKDLGISKKDSGICEKISDSNIKATCKNRVLEDTVDEIMGNGDLPS